MQSRLRGAMLPNRVLYVFCVLQAILTATARPQGISDTGVQSALSVVGTAVVPIDEPGCQKEGSVAAGSADDGGSGNPAVQVLKVGADKGCDKDANRDRPASVILCWPQDRMHTETLSDC